MGNAKALLRTVKYRGNHINFTIQTQDAAFLYLLRFGSNNIGAGGESRTPISALGRLHNGRYTTPAQVLLRS
jgi:hypothetical protein